MQVFIVIHDIYYETARVLAVCGSIEKAREVAASRNAEDREDRTLDEDGDWNGRVSGIVTEVHNVD